MARVVIEWLMWEPLVLEVLDSKPTTHKYLAICILYYICSYVVSLRKRIE